jgi:hypothetical protein
LEIPPADLENLCHTLTIVRDRSGDARDALTRPE